MVTWMEHPKHGRHPAIGADIELMKKDGWTVCHKKAVLKLVKEIVVAEKPIGIKRQTRAIKN